MPYGGEFGAIPLNHWMHRGAHDRVQRIAQIRVVQPIIVFGALTNRGQEIAAILSHSSVNEPRRQIGARVDQLVLGLWSAQPMVIDGVAVERRLQHFALGRLRISRVKESFVIGGPEMPEKHIQ